MFALEIHDAGLLAIPSPGNGPGEAGESPGFALLEGSALYTGTAAAGRARSLPKAVHSRFWQDLSLDPAGPPFPEDWSLGDLAHAHLEELWSRYSPHPEPTLLLLPPTFSTHQLGILLGIFQAAGRPVAALVDSAVAAVRASGIGGPVLYLDPQLHRFAATGVSAGETVVGGATEVLPGAGLEDLNRIWARHISEALVLATRFDPLHGGSTEQRLYDRLPAWLDEAREGEDFEARFETRGGEFRTRVPREALLAAAGEAYSRIGSMVRGLADRLGGARLLLSHRAARWPGLAERLQSLDPRGPVTLSRGATAEAVPGILRDLPAPGPGPGRPFLRRLPASGEEENRGTA